MKKQVKKLSKKILVLVLATSIIFTSCFSYKKINAHATGAVAALSAYTLYEICLYIGGLAVTTLGIGYAYENRDEIAEFGKFVIDSMIDIPEQGWFFGATSAQEDPTIYGREALVAAQMAAWAYIVTGGQSPKNDNNNDDDDDEGNEGDNGNEGESSEPVNDYDKRSKELSFTNFFLTSAGLNLFEDCFKEIYDSSVDETSNVLNFAGLTNVYVLEDIYYSDLSSPSVRTEVCNKLKELHGNNVSFNGWYVTRDGYYLFLHEVYRDMGLLENGFRYSSAPLAYINIEYSDGSHRIGFDKSDVIQTTVKPASPTVYSISGSYWRDDNYRIEFCNAPMITTQAEWDLYNNYGLIPGVNDKVYRVADWIAEDEEWKGYLEDIATSLRSLQDLTAVAQQLADGALTTQPSADAYGDMMVNLGEEYAPKTDPITDPVYWPATNTTPKLDPSVFPNYQPGVNPNPDSGTNSSPDDGDGGGSDEEIDLDGLGSIFSILFYLIMIIIMLIYLFLACLAFIVMIFRIPASSSMLPDEMVMGFDHLKTIMIPGMNISIYGFAMALIYLLIIFTVIKILRLEINDFKFPRAGRKP